MVMGDTLDRTVQALARALDGREPRRLEEPRARPAAVLMPLREGPAGVEVVLTKRTSHLPHHAGQVSFPGGASDPEDGGPEETALRETCEEIGVCREAARVVARLDQVVTVTNFLVTPFLGVLDGRAELAPSPHEVERLLRVPLAKVLDREQWRPTEVRWQGMAFHHEALSHDGEVVWGATARIILALVERLGPAAAGVVQASKSNGQKGVDRPGGLV
jgi:8-oxo-dGTP pyrophosphatase MutT (NUDIX family)